MYKDYRYINAGENEFYRYGHKAVERLSQALIPNEAGFYNVAANGGKYWTFGTSNGKYGEFAKWNDCFFSVNGAGFVWAKVGTEKAAKFVEMINSMISAMNAKNAERFADYEEDED